MVAYVFFKSRKEYQLCRIHQILLFPKRNLFTGSSPRCAGDGDK